MPTPTSGKRSPWLFVLGRRRLLETPYFLPKDRAEDSRQDLQHTMLKAALGGNYLAPLIHPSSILDVGCGTGRWGREMAQQFKSANVIGIDLVTEPLQAAQARLGKRGRWPRNFSFLQSNALKPFPFPSEQFDMVHARFTASFVPKAHWMRYLTELVRVTRSGGWIEVLDGTMPRSQSPAYRMLTKAALKLASQRDLVHDEVLERASTQLVDARLVQVQERRLTLGTRVEERQALARNLAVGFAGMVPTLVKAGLLSASDAKEALENLEQELLADATLVHELVVSWGQRP